MYIQVKLLNGWQEPLWYEAPDEWNNEPLQGSLVRVPLQKRVTTGLVIAASSHKPRVSFKLRAALAREPFPADSSYSQFLEQLSSYYQIEPLQLYKRMRHFLEQAAHTQEVPTHHDLETNRSSFTLTDEQQQAYNLIAPAITLQRYEATLLHGVTGSGKTEVYKHLICTALNHQKTVLLLLPEVTLALQFEKLLRAQLPQCSLYGFHSGTSPKDKMALWHDLLNHKSVIIIGVHLPILLPIRNLGLIIVDEEHEVGYQEKKYPKINSKEAALIRAHSAHIPIVLGSATPSLNSLYNVQHKGWRYIQLTKRFSGNFPTIKTINLSDGKQRRNFWISIELEKAIKERLEKKEQIIIFLNRRGYSFFVQCKSCSFIFSCSSCSVSLTLHQDNSLACHYCDYKRTLPTTCPQCCADEKEFLKKGIGTQQVVSILEKLFPQARIARADLDVTTKKRTWQKTLHDFEQGTLDILVGTQTITKGLHFPRVTLVGILWADINLHFPIYNATETALQQLIQVAGRAGRQSSESLVIVQTLADHPVMTFLDERAYKNFYEQELEHRMVLNYPPCSRLVELELRHEQEEVIEQESTHLVRILTHACQKSFPDITILGPAKPSVHKIKNLHMRKIYLKGKNMQALQNIYQSIAKKRFTCAILFTPNPTS